MPISTQQLAFISPILVNVVHFMDVSRSKSLVRAEINLKVYAGMSGQFTEQGDLVVETGWGDDGQLIAKFRLTHMFRDLRWQDP